MITTWDDFVRDAEGDFGPIGPDTLSIVNDLVVQAVMKRIDLGWTQARLAEEAGLKQAAISRFESFTVVPRMDTLVKILKALGLKLTVSCVETGETLVDVSHPKYDVGESSINVAEATQSPVDVFMSPSELIAYAGDEPFYEVNNQLVEDAA